MELSRGGEPSDWLFLSMARAQLGDLEEARFWYDRTVE